MSVPLSTGPGTRPRIPEIDAVRGLALCGILLVNLVGITGLRVGGEGPTRHLYEALLHQRFFPVFSFLFGLGAALLLRSLEERTERPRAVLLARLGFLIPFGMAHQALQPGEVLVAYAVFGIVVLLPASFLPRAVVLAAGAAVTVAALATGGGTALIPGLFLLGMAAAAYDLQVLGTRRVVVAFGVLAGLAVALNLGRLALGALDATAGVVTGAAYATGLLVVLTWDFVAAPLCAVLVPLGRLALTNYITATPLILVADRLLDLGNAPHPATVLATGAAILTLQTLFARAWLRRFHHGPLEWAWRCLTWWRPVPNRLPTTACRIE
ncbi:DUF418 domain-containing protein [Thermomonospora umbrina]|uniref:Putative membrane protein YeiB n=1 Tax=Thermomonospora umbrina TaxID=111806 RepID=A0A3D9SWD0_9ACTN|nr:DUF418 domain-containing protein [Thermomonospora umbrina]REE97295.1 putative membrane protein YeiB [Thermomonospora umbrina]